VTLLQSGLEIERGSVENFRIVYNESNSRVEVGLISNLQPITLRESSPLLNGIMTWNESTKRIESNNQITIPITFTNTINSTSSSSGTLIVNGGLGIKKDMYIDGRIYFRGSTHGNFANIWTDTSTNEFNISNSNDINITPNTRINIPFNKYISFGNSNQSIVANSLTNALTITSSGDIYLTPETTKKIKVPNQIPITFSTDTEQIYADSSNNIVIASSQDVYLYPNNGNAAGKKVFIPVDTSLAFGSSSQYLSANITNDLTIAANNNILLNPGSTLDVKIPIDAGVRFGAGYQRITANSSNDLSIFSQGDLYLTPQAGSRVKLPVSTHLSFGSNTQYIMGDSSGNVTITANDGSGTVFLNANVQINGTTQNVYSTVTNIQDPVFSLGGVTSPTFDDFKDRGIEFKWYGTRNGITGSKVGFFGFDNSTQRFTYIPFATNANEIITGTPGDAQFTNGYFDNLTLLSTVASIHLTSGSIITAGGITIQCSTNAASVTNGGSLLTPGGASIGSDIYVGGTIYGLADVYLGNIYAYSTSSDNYIQSPNNGRTADSFLPIHFTKYNNTAANIISILDTGIILNNNNSLQIGGSIGASEGYILRYTTGNFNIIPNDTTANYNLNIGTIGNSSNVNIYGYNSGQITWKSTTASLIMTNTSLELNKSDSTGSIVLTTPNTSSASFIQASSTDMILNIGGGNTGSQLTTILSNDIGDATITFTPSNITTSTLTVTDNVYSTFNGITSFTNRVEYSGNALHQTVNNTNGTSLWIYMGQINTSGTESGYCEIDFNNGVNVSSNTLSGLKVLVAINNTTCIASHAHYGNITFDSANKPICYIYNDTINDYHLFVKLAPNSQTNINVTAQRHDIFLNVFEGIGSYPSGAISGYTGLWTLEYDTQKESTLKNTTGDLTVENQLIVNDNVPIVGYNTTTTNDIGILYQRYQRANDTGTGDVVNDSPAFIDTIPSQFLVPDLYQIKFSSSANATNNYYVGWWIKIISGPNINQVRRITAYSGSQRVATLETSFTSQNPSENDIVHFYNNSYVTTYYDETIDTFSVGYTPSRNTIITLNDTINLKMKGIYSTDTTASTNSSSGSVYILGGISINNTNDATSATNGGTITTAGGIAVRKDLRIGNKLGLGTHTFTTEESIHIRKTTSTARFEHDNGSYSYIDFTENGTSNRYGILLDSVTNQFCLTKTSTSQTPNNSYKALTINNLGYIGINTTTNVVSPLGINANNYISTNSTTGYLGLIGGATNINSNTVGSRINLYANNQTTASQGCLNLYAGHVTGGNVSIFTNNDIERLQVNHDGVVNILTTHPSNNSTTGALITAGGISIKSTQNATSTTSGGGLTVAGGSSIAKDLFIGGNITVTGTFTSYGAITSPTLTQSNETNCTFIEYYSNTLTANDTFCTLVFGFTVNPSNASENCSIEFTLPNRTTTFTKRFDVISTCNGYTNDTDVIPLMNILSFGQTGTTRLKIKFQSVSTSAHYLQVTAMYYSI